MYNDLFQGRHGRRRRRSSRRRFDRIFADVRKWLYRNSRLAILIGGGIVLLAAILLIVFLVIVPAAKDKAPDAQEGTVSMEGLEGEDLEEAEEYQQQLESGEIDDETLAGLTGDGLEESDLVIETEEQPVMVGMICGADSRSIAEGFGKRAEELIDAGSGIESYLVYEVEEESPYNAQVQDVRSLINRGCKVIVVADVNEQTYGMIVTLASKNDVAIVAVNAPEGAYYDVNVTAEGGDSAKVLAQFIASNASPGTVETITSSSSFGKAMTSAYSSAFAGKGFTAADVFTWGGEGYAEAFAGKLAERPKALAVEGKIAVKVLEEGAKNGYIGEVFATEASAGFIKKWYTMRNGGLTVTETVKNEDGTETTKTLASGFNSSCKIIATIGSDKTAMGSAACEFATKLATGHTLKEESIVYSLPAPKPITDAELQTYYNKYKDASDDTPISAEAANADVSAYFNAPVNTPS